MQPEIAGTYVSLKNTRSEQVTQHLLYKQEFGLGMEQVQVLIYKQELDLDLEQVKDLVRKPEPGLNMELLTKVYKRELDLELTTLETKVQLLKFNSMKAGKELTGFAYYFNLAAVENTAQEK